MELHAIDLGMYPLGSYTMKYNPRGQNGYRAADGIRRFLNIPTSHRNSSQGWQKILCES